MIFIQLFVAGLAVGALYAVVALGFTLVWNASGTVNFAQGQLVMVGAFIAYTGVALLRWPYIVVLPLTVALTFALGVVLERLTIRPLRSADPLLVIIVTIGTAIALESLARNVWGPDTVTMPGISGDTLIHTHGIVIQVQSIWILVIAAAAMLGLRFLFSGTVLGRAMRAVAQDRETAAQMGVPVSRMVTLTFGLNGAMAGLAGLLLAPIVFISASMGIAVTIQAFVAAVMGGFGSLLGAVVGGLMLGLITVFAATFSGAYADAVSLLVLIGILVVSPRGLFRTSW